MPPRRPSDEELESKIARTAAAMERFLDGPLTHATYEELAALVDGTLDDVQQEIVETHLEDCAMCAAELADLRLVATPAAKGVRRERSTRTRRMRTAWLLAASLVAAIGIGWWLAGRGTPEPGHRPPPARNLIVLRDQRTEIALDDRGQIHGVAAPLAGAAAALLRNPSIPPPAVLASVRTAAAVLRGSQEQQLTALAPIGRIVLDERPEFSWSGARKSARVTVYEESSLRRVGASGEVEGGRWRAEAPLPRGVTLTWQVASHGMLAPPPSEPPARFRIVDAAAFARIDEARRSGSHLLLGAAFAEAGLRDEATAELRELVALNPQSTEARSLLESVESWPR